MTLKTKISLMLSSFFILIAILALGSMAIFGTLSERMGTLRTISEESNLYNELDRNIGDLVDAARGWGLTAEAKYKKQYFDKISDVRKSFGNLSAVHKNREDLDRLGKDFQQILNYSEVVIRDRYPVGNPEVIEFIKIIDIKAIDIISKIDEMQEYTTNSILNIATVGDEIKKKMVYYQFALISFSFLATFFLVVTIRRAFSVPFSELLKATERISKGEMSYRIGMDRDDEFGTLGKRFDSMVIALESSNTKITQKLNETELLLDIAQFAGTTLDLKGALHYIVETISLKLHYDNCAVYMMNAERKGFSLEASNVIEENANKEGFSFENRIANEIITYLQPVVISDEIRRQLKKRFWENIRQRLLSR